MNCQECGNNPATLHFTKIVNGNKTEFHLCESCARDKSDLIPGTANGFSIHNLLSGFMNTEPPHSTLESKPKLLRCENCGLTYSQFAKMGRFGCSSCYKYFSSRLDPVLRRVHGNTNHVGKVPKRTGGLIKHKREISDLKNQLQQCVEQEEFEKAASIRDEIRMLEKKIEQFEQPEQPE